MRRSAIVAAFIAIVILAAGIFVKGAITLPAIGNWLAAGSMTTARSGAAAVLLQDHRVLITGGNDANGPTNSAESFETDGTFAAVAPMGMARASHNAIVLQDGRVLVAGGAVSGGAAINSAEIFTPGVDTWAPVASGMVEARANATATLLADGRVLIAGGQNGGVPSQTIEIFDPVASQFRFAGTLSAPRMGLGSALMADGRVLIAGGSNGTVPLNTADIFDPTTNTISAGPVLTTPRVGHSATLLLDGRVLLAGGNNGSADVASVEIYDPATGSFAVAGSSLAAPRRDHTAILLPNNNNVLILGGTSNGNETNSVETFTPWTGAFAGTGAMTVARQHAASSALSQDGLLLTTGGTSAGAPANSSELYGFATVKTDKSDYAPGEIVTITGSGWKPGETVSLTMVESPFYDSHGPFTAVADSTGSIFNNQFSPDEHDEDIRFYLTAVGSVSGIQAQNTFTDAITLNSVTVGSQTGSVAAGTAASATYAICVAYNGNNSAITFSVLPGLPAGVTAGFSANAINNPAKCPATSTTLTLSTTRTRTAMW